MKINTKNLTLTMLMSCGAFASLSHGSLVDEIHATPHQQAQDQDTIDTISRVIPAISQSFPKKLKKWEKSPEDQARNIFHLMKNLELDVDGNKIGNNVILLLELRNIYHNQHITKKAFEEVKKIGGIAHACLFNRYAGRRVLNALFKTIREESAREYKTNLCRVIYEKVSPTTENLWLFKIREESRLFQYGFMQFKFAHALDPQSFENYLPLREKTVIDKQRQILNPGNKFMRAEDFFEAHETLAYLGLDITFQNLSLYKILTQELHFFPCDLTLLDFEILRRMSGGPDMSYLERYEVGHCLHKALPVNTWTESDINLACHVYDALGRYPFGSRSFFAGQKLHQFTPSGEDSWITPGNMAFFKKMFQKPKTVTHEDFLFAQRVQKQFHDTRAILLLTHGSPIALEMLDFLAMDQHCLTVAKNLKDRKIEFTVPDIHARRVLEERVKLRYPHGNHWTQKQLGDQYVKMIELFGKLTKNQKKYLGNNPYKCMAVLQILDEMGIPGIKFHFKDVEWFTPRRLKTIQDVSRLDLYTLDRNTIVVLEKLQKLHIPMTSENINAARVLQEKRALGLEVPDLTKESVAQAAKKIGHIKDSVFNATDGNDAPSVYKSMAICLFLEEYGLTHFKPNHQKAHWFTKDRVHVIQTMLDLDISPMDGNSALVAEKLLKKGIPLTNETVEAGRVLQIRQAQKMPGHPFILEGIEEECKKIQTLKKDLKDQIETYKTYIEKEKNNKKVNVTAVRRTLLELEKNHKSIQFCTEKNYHLNLAILRIQKDFDVPTSSNILGVLKVIHLVNEWGVGLPYPTTRDQLLAELKELRILSKGLPALSGSINGIPNCELNKVNMARARILKHFDLPLTVNNIRKVAQLFYQKKALTKQSILDCS